MRSGYLIALGAAIGLLVLARRYATEVTDVTTAAGNTVRGIRNNNPGNLRYFKSIAWNGQIGDDGHGYAVFDTMTNGVRAMVKDLASDYRDGQNTVRKLIYEFAPPSDGNPTSAYAANVASALMVGLDQPIDVLRYMHGLVRAIVRQELGAAGAALVSDAAIAAGIRAANV